MTSERRQSSLLVLWNTPYLLVYKTRIQMLRRQIKPTDLIAFLPPKSTSGCGGGKLGELSQLIWESPAFNNRQSCETHSRLHHKILKGTEPGKARHPASSRDKVAGVWLRYGFPKRLLRDLSYTVIPIHPSAPRQKGSTVCSMKTEQADPYHHIWLFSPDSKQQRQGSLQITGLNARSSNSDAWS